MERFEDIELRLSVSEDPEEQLKLNELTLARNMVKHGKKGAMKGMGQITLPIPGTNPVKRRIGIFDRERYTSSDVDIDIMQGTICSEKVLVIEDDCVAAQVITGTISDRENEYQ